MKVVQKHVIEIDVEYDTDKCEGLTGADLIGYIDYMLNERDKCDENDAYHITDVTVWAGAAEYIAEMSVVVTTKPRPEDFNDLPLPLPLLEPDNFSVADSIDY